MRKKIGLRFLISPLLVIGTLSLCFTDKYAIIAISITLLCYAICIAIDTCTPTGYFDEDNIHNQVRKSDETLRNLK